MPLGLKLIVASTPKTGNTWLRHLLSALYELPMPELPVTFDDETMKKLPESWVAQQHYYPGSALLDWVQRERAVVLTTIRHPGDVLLSLFHYVRSHRHDPAMDRHLLTLMRFDFEGPAENLSHFVRDYFFCDLHISIGWLRTGGAVVVRYEDLVRNTEKTLTDVAESIRQVYPGAGVTPDRISRAVAMCELDLLRKTPGLNPTFFRQGRCGEWKRELPAQIIEILRTQEPYPAQFKSLGYSLDVAEPTATPSAAAGPSRNPFIGVTHFQDGVRVSPILVRLFLGRDEGSPGSRHPTGGRADPESFLKWLCDPAGVELSRGGEPRVTNLVMELHRSRLDLQSEFPDPFGKDRVGLVDWFLRNAEGEYNLDPVFLLEARDAFVGWAVALAGGGLNDEPSKPPISNLALQIYSTREDLQRAFPNLGGPDRFRYLSWVLSRGAVEHELDCRIVERMRAGLSEWACRRDGGLANLAVQLHATRPELQARFPDAAGRDRAAYMKWFDEEGPLALPEVRQFRFHAAPALERWVRATSPEDPGGIPRLTNLAVHIYRSRPDLQERFPDVFGRHRGDFVRWLIQPGADEYALTREELAPVLGSI